MSAPPNAVADQLAEALRELKREVDDPEYDSGFDGYRDIVISPRTERLVDAALRAYSGSRA